MKIRIVFASDLHPDPGTEILQLLPGSSVPDMETLQAYAAAWDIAVITPTFANEGRYVMACVTAENCVLQPMCFPQNSEICPGEDIAVVEFPWGKLALCCEADVFRPQYARLAALKGCTLMAVSFPWEYAGLIMAGPWSVCQANCLPIALAQQSGGQVILPCPMTQDNSGFGRTDFDTDELAGAYREFPVFDSLNADFYERFREVLEA